MSVEAAAAIVAFVSLVAFLFWFSFRQAREVRSWLDKKIASEGWTPTADDSAIEKQGWNWFVSLREGRDVRIDRLATNPTPAPIESAFTLVTRRYGERAGAKRYVGAGLVVRTSHPIAPSVVLTPVPSMAGGPFLKWFLALDLPTVTLKDQRLASRWSAYSPEPEAATDLLTSAPALTRALNQVFERAIYRQTMFHVLIMEFHGDRLALLGGPKIVGRQPFDDLAAVAADVTRALA